MAVAVDVAVADRAILGECPVWCERTQSLYWLDCREPALHAWTPGTAHRRRWPLDEWTGSVVRCGTAGWICAGASGFRHLDEITGKLSVIAATAPIASVRLNDGKCDPAGRFWAGEVDSLRRGPIGRLWRLDADLSCRRMEGAFTIFNGLGWSPDGRVMYTCDSWTGEICAAGFDSASGIAGPPRHFARIEGGQPDGAAVDEEGCLWVAIFDGWRLCRFAPDGRLLAETMLPVQRPTSCSFGGPGLDLLFITTATVRLSDAELAGQPAAGSVLVLEPGVRGLPARRFAGAFPAARTI